MCSWVFLTGKEGSLCSRIPLAGQESSIMISLQWQRWRILLLSFFQWQQRRLCQNPSSCPCQSPSPCPHLSSAESPSQGWCLSPFKFLFLMPSWSRFCTQSWSRLYKPRRSWSHAPSLSQLRCLCLLHFTPMPDVTLVFLPMLAAVAVSFPMPVDVKSCKILQTWVSMPSFIKTGR